MPWWGIVLIVIGALLAVSVVLYFTVGKKLLKKQADVQEKIDAATQTLTIFVIDKKKMPLKEAHLPKSVMEQAPALTKLAKVHVVKAKIGKQIMEVIAEKDVFEKLPVKKNCKVTMSGIYVTGLLKVF